MYGHLSCVLFRYYTRLRFIQNQVGGLFLFLQLKKHLLKKFLFILILVFYSAQSIAGQLSDVAAQQESASPEKSHEEISDKKPEVTFDIWEYRVAGNTLLSRTILERSLAPYLGPNKSSSVINDAADALERLYKDNGYPTIFVDIPAQDVVAGVVRLQINAGKISRLRITGADYFTLSGLKEKVPSLQTGQSIHMPSVQEDISRLHAYSPDLQAVPVLKAGRDPGTMEIELRVKDKLPLHGSLELNNHYSANTTELRMEGSISYDNLWQKFHSLKIIAQLSPENTEEVRALVVNYIMPVNDDRNRLAFYTVKSDSDISAVGGLAVIGKGNIYGVRYVVPLENSRSWMHSTTLGIDYKDVEDLVNLSGGLQIKTPIQYVVSSASYSATSLAKTSTTRYSAAMKFGIRGPNSRGEFEDKRFKANPDFIYFRGDINRTDMLPSDIKIESRFNVQLSASPLISNEQFTAGGYLTVRGYLESQLLGDDGASMSVELFSPGIFRSETGSWRTRLLAFADGAFVETLEPLPGQERQSSIYSAGVGLRVTKSKHLIVKLDWAYPLRAAGDEASGTFVGKGDSRLVFSLAYSF